ncbi:MAG: radical SAM protein [Labilithrix sp.]|nr:radical SAM protein [Labilithrix sp.]
MAPRFLFNEVVLQPTSLCNLDCSYCYVPHRKEDRRMQPAVTERLAASLAALPKHEHPIYLLWHCGEPLAVGPKHMKALFAPFEELRARGKIAHRLQTNGTLVDRAWCDFFIEHNVEIAVSLDGPPPANKHRLHWNGRESFEKTLRGIERLKEIGCETVLLAVVTEDRLGDAQELYDFFAKIGCVRLGINIEERVGTNLVRPMVRAARVDRFWSELHAAYRKNPVVEVRELALFDDWWRATGGAAPPPEEQITYRSNYLPTVGYDGGVVFLSTELLQCDAGKYGTFEIGNILEDTLDDLVRRAKKTPYVLDFLAGVDACKASCPYYSFCGGGFATNKFFELGTMNGTETRACVNARKRLFDTLAKERAGDMREAG